MDTVKKILNIASKVVTWLLVAFTVFMMIFTIVTVTTVDKNERSIFGMKFYIVKTDSMSKSDKNADLDVHFDAGDIILIKNIDNSERLTLETLELPDTLTNIGRFAFYGCTSFSELFIPKNVEHIGQHAFYYTDSVDLYFESDILPLYLDEYWDEGVRSYHFDVASVNTTSDWKYAVLESGKI